MNRETWFRILQVAVVAPFIYSISEKQTGYFRLGLKLVAGSIVIMNIEPIMKELQPLIEAAAKMQADAARLSEGEKEAAIEGEFSPSEV